MRLPHAIDMIRTCPRSVSRSMPTTRADIQARAARRGPWPPSRMSCTSCRPRYVIPGSSTAPLFVRRSPLAEDAWNIARTSSGDCVFFNRTGARLCAIHEAAGVDALPTACRHFPAHRAARRARHLDLAVAFLPDRSGAAVRIGPPRDRRCRRTPAPRGAGRRTGWSRRPAAARAARTAVRSRGL